MFAIRDLPLQPENANCNQIFMPTLRQSLVEAISQKNGPCRNLFNFLFQTKLVGAVLKVCQLLSTMQNQE